jgi:hypothetical protein
MAQGQKKKLMDSRLEYNISIFWKDESTFLKGRKELHQPMVLLNVRMHIGFVFLDVVLHALFIMVV